MVHPVFVFFISSVSSVFPCCCCCCCCCCLERHIDNPVVFFDISIGGAFYRIGRWGVPMCVVTPSRKILPEGWDGV